MEDKGGFDIGNVNISAAMLDRYWHFAFAQASAQAHNFGRVTCPIEGMVNGQMVNINPGFWNPSFRTAKGYFDDGYGTLTHYGTDTIHGHKKYGFLETNAAGSLDTKKNVPPKVQKGIIYAKIKGKEKLRHTQCDWGTETMDYSEDYCPTHFPSSECKVRPNGPVRQTSSLFADWEKYDREENETDFNIEAGFCNLPGQAARAPEGHENPVDIGTSATISRWDGAGRFGLFMTMHFFQNDGERAFKPDFNQWQQQQGFKASCTKDLYLPTELANLASVTLPSTPALDYFLEIAWDGVDSIDSAWDNCKVGSCQIPLNENRLCGGSGVDRWMPDGAGQSS
jgi:hypothetical protein